ncbi:type I-E CRISPR-associated protein Cas7/Cse4/CasC [Marinitenerispora sediminis]|uniref:Type I-E CRISPR-associated protein Cas7/Cse4/CasC n=1 Tax=Marinitenerispora sediminis TaxID=1931232 RepID=A0A368T2F5_9ACTN|nr:type I-E CRISPR-associated protein Cas7/Cse4/CasC [Marinitenerispora sediminis]RCV51382.1 type I-E CRISPR-associated protein Cas7/Cse4/CasC [Marinitenerispora sediminis]RCV55085.1 type I-E CRISPR-associated protein Cas7/Cse4/CasC [Marinitenerispora sediminis]RCV58107.1 type I-E CRISPR-associated protein Cas7/Cse4/CasC [Marinitenerispora sediminis]
MTTAAYLDIHALQTLPYSNINRDDIGLPKTVEYGGYERTRVSSQSWKRAVRHEVETRLGDRAVRTRRLAAGIAARLEEQGWDPYLAREAGRQVVAAAGKGIKLEKEQDGQAVATSVLLYLPAPGIDQLVEVAARHREEIAKEAAKKKPGTAVPSDEVSEILRSRSGTINLFGRMLAELPGADVDGAVQFAHAFTVHGTEVETDFFTAVDDIPSAAGDRGSGHMNVGQFSAGTFYRYANVNVAGLLRNLDGDAGSARELVGEFLTAFLRTVPTGKQNATAAMTLPDLVYVAVRGDRPVSFAPAFEQPVAGNRGYAAAARSALSGYATNLHALWGREEIRFDGHAGIDGESAKLTGLGDRHDSVGSVLSGALGAAFGPAE